MNKKERLLCALSLEEPDQVPIYDLVDHRGILSRFGGQELTLENASTVVPKAISQLLDTTRLWLPQPPGKRVDRRGFEYEQVDWWNEWKMRAPYQDPSSMLAWVKWEIEQVEAWQPADPAAKMAEFKEWQAKFGDTVLPASTAGEALQDAFIQMDIEQFTFFEQDHPDLVTHWIEALHQATMRRLQSEAGLAVLSPIAWVFADIAFNNHLMFSKRYLKARGYFQHLHEIFDLYHSYGLKVIFHSDGDITTIIPELIAAGADALAPVDTPAGMNLADLKQAYGKQVAFVGGVDLSVISAGSVEDVRLLTRQVLKEAGQGGGLVLGSSSEELYETIPEENILAMWETTWEYGRYPF